MFTDEELCRLSDKTLMNWRQVAIEMEDTKLLQQFQDEITRRNKEQ